MIIRKKLLQPLLCGKCVADRAFRFYDFIVHGVLITLLIGSRQRSQRAGFAILSHTGPLLNHGEDMTKLQPRGIRLNNPGNICHSKDPWQGKSDDQPDPSFIKFKAPEWGIRAAARVLIVYQDRHGCDTISSFIERWAPEVENNTNAYIKHVGALMNRSPDEPIDVHKFEDIEPLVRAIIKHENGVQPYSDETIKKGLELAGVTKKPGPAAKSGIVIGSTTAAVAAPLSQISATIQQTQAAITPLADTLEIARWVLLGLAIAGAGVALYAKLRDIRQQQAVAS